MMILHLKVDNYFYCIVILDGFFSRCRSSHLIMMRIFRKMTLLFFFHTDKILLRNDIDVLFIRKIFVNIYQKSHDQ